jgi:hypothetical protein
MGQKLYSRVVVGDDSGGVSFIDRIGGVAAVSNDAGATFTPIGASASLPSTQILADAATNTAPDGSVERHTTSGTPAAGFGLTDAVELQSAAGNVRRASSDVVDYASATDGAEEARRTFNVVVGGALSAHSRLTYVASSANNPAFFLGNPASAMGLIRAGASNLQLMIGSAILDMTAALITANVPIACVGKILSTDSLKQGAALTNADLSKDVAAGSEFTLPAATLSASHVLTLAVTGSPITNQIIRVTRLDVTANTYVVKDDAATTLLTFPASTKGMAEFKFNGTHFVLDRYAVLN